MSSEKTNGQMSFREQVKRSGNVEQLKDYVRKSKYIEKVEQSNVCSSFGLPYLPSVFRLEYTKRIKEHLRISTTTAATVSKATGIPHKYICQVKALLQEKGGLKIVGFGKCPTTGSSNVQFLSTNPANWNNKSMISDSN